MGLGRVVAVFVGLLFVAGTLQADQPLPRLVIEAPAYDFGAVEQGTTVEHVFLVRNAGTASLRVDRVQASCACASGMTAGRVIAPGDTAWVDMRLDTAKLAGRTTKVLALDTNDPWTPRFGLALSGEVLTDLRVEPTPLYFGRIRPGERVRREVLVVPGRPGGVDQVSLAEVGSRAFRVHVEPGDVPGTQRVVVETNGDLPPGRLNDQLVLRTTSPRQPSLTIPILGTVGMSRSYGAGLDERSRPTDTRRPAS